MAVLLVDQSYLNFPPQILMSGTNSDYIKGQKKLGLQIQRKALVCFGLAWLLKII
jgi:hypothetical protein